jgi:hypothetical protein
VSLVPQFVNSGETFPAQCQHGLGEIHEGTGLQVRASLQYAVSKKAGAGTELKNPNAQRQRRDSASNVISDVRAPGPALVSCFAVSCRFCWAVPVVP